MLMINAWWEQNPAERYWLEVTDRENLGDDLIAPAFASNGRSTPGYALVQAVKPDDIVFTGGSDRATSPQSSAARRRWVTATPRLSPGRPEEPPDVLSGEHRKPTLGLCRFPTSSNSASQ